MRHKVFAFDKVISWQISQVEEKIHLFGHFFDISSERLIGFYRETDYLSHQIDSFLYSQLERANDKVENLKKYILSFDVSKVLSRGFSLTYGKDGKIIKSVFQVKTKDLVTTRFFDGKIESEVKRIL